MKNGVDQKPVALITAAQVAAKLNVPITWVREHTRSRCKPEMQIPHRKLGKYTRFSEAEIDRWIENGCRQVEGAR